MTGRKISDSVRGRLVSQHNPVSCKRVPQRATIVCKRLYLSLSVSSRASANEIAVFKEICAI